MVNPDQRVLEVALRLNAPDFKPFVDWLKARREAAREKLEGDLDAKVQGAAIELKQILECIECAPKALEQLRAKK